MIRSLYTVVSGMITLENKQNTITNNITNSETTGYKSENLNIKSFDEVMIANRDKIVNGKNVKQRLGTISLGSEIDNTSTTYTQGDLSETEKNTDMAIVGRGFFSVQSGNKIVYTRDGNFRIDNQGYLVTTTGDRVLGMNNGTGNAEPIFVGDSDFYIDDNNNIYVNGNSTQSLMLADFQDYSELKKIGDNYYTGDNPVYNAVVSVRQGFLETSNVNVTNEMVNMITTMRNYESDSSILKMIDNTLNIVCNQVGKL